MRRLLSFSFLLWIALSCAAFAKAKDLQIYSIDVEGGQATLFVSPSGESLLIDTGWAGYKGRDADRILEATKLAHVTKLDFVLITHYHRDHVGGVTQLAERIPIGTFVDHGPNREDSDDTRKDFAAYVKLAGNRRMTVTPGEGLPLKGITVRILTADGEQLDHPLPGAGTANPYCDSERPADPDPSENSRSLGVLITYGKFRVLDLGDLTKQKELNLVCPNNLIGTADLFIVTHHGTASSNSKAAVWAFHPRVAIMNNGAKKGGNPPAWRIVHSSPGLEDLWQLHYAEEGGKDNNVAPAFIANIDDGSDGHYLKVTARSDGSFTVFNSRTHRSKTYKK
jgi:competence protein ComEC